MRNYREVPSAPEFKEGEKIPETKVILYFMRHEEKEEGKTSQTDIEFEDIELTKEGKKAAIRKGRETLAQPAVSWAAGSPRIRSAHTALLRMMAGKETITSEMTFSEAMKEAERGLTYGKKVRLLPELNFLWKGGFKDKVLPAYKAGRGLEFFLQESDNLVCQLKDKESLSYSRVAANYASLIARQMDTGNNFNRIVANDPKKYAPYGNQLERYFGTHQTVSECFYMKVLEKLYGRKKAEEFIESFRDDKGRADGFGFQEGFEVRIINGPEGQKIILEGVRGFSDIELTPELLRDIIADAEKLDEEIEKIEKMQ